MGVEKSVLSDIERIREMVEKVRQEHYSTSGYDSAGEPIYNCCSVCDEELWPCVTLRLAEKVLVLAEASALLATKLRKLEDCAEFRSVFVLAQIHGQPYRGENFAAELEQVEHALSKAAK